MASSYAAQQKADSSGSSAMNGELRRLLYRHDKLDQQRRYYLPMWQEIADRLMPDSSNILRIYSPGSKRTQWMFDATAPLALKKFADAMESMICPATTKWHGLRDANDDLNNRPEVQDYYEKVTDKLFRVRYAKGTNFTQQANECFVNTGAYGNAAMYIDDCLGRGIRYRSLHIKELFFAENFCGNIDLLDREFSMSVRQAYQRFEGNLPPGMLKAYEQNKDELTEYRFIHSVEPNPDYVIGADGLRGMQFLSHYFCWDQPWMCRTGFGYKSFPYAVSRFMTIAGDVYARGPASLILPDIKQVNEMEKVNMRQGQLAADPPILLPEDGNLSGFNMQPGALVWGGTNEDGKPMALPFNSGSNFQVSLEMQEQKRKLINDAFYITLFQILVQNPTMTATEALLRAQEKAQLLMPTMGRTQTEFCTGIIDREIEILESAGELPPKPTILEEQSEGIKAEYVSPLNRAQQAEEGVAINNTLQSIGILAQFDPTVTKIVKGVDAARVLARVNGMHVNLLKTDEEMDKEKEQMAKQEQMANLLAAAPAAASAAKDFAQAQSMAGQGAPPQAAPVALPQAA